MFYFISVPFDMTIRPSSVPRRMVNDGNHLGQSDNLTGANGLLNPARPVVPRRRIRANHTAGRLHAVFRTAKVCSDSGGIKSVAKVPLIANHPHEKIAFAVVVCVFLNGLLDVSILRALPRVGVSAHILIANGVIPSHVAGSVSKNFRPRWIVSIRLVIRRVEVVMIDGIQRPSDSNLPFVIDAGNPASLGFGPAQCGQDQASEDGDK